MFRFFRQIRQKLFSGNRLTTYLLYGLGEILLVVLGILIALWIDNWNKEKEQQKAFVTTLEQIYTHLHSAKELEKWDIARCREQLELCQAMQRDLDSFSNVEILKYAYFLDWIPGTGFKLANFEDYLGKIEVESDDAEKSSLLFHLNQFFIMVNQALDHDYNNYKEKYFEPLFRQNDIPLSSGQVHVDRILNASRGAHPLLSDPAIEKIDILKESEEFQAALLSTEDRLNKIITTLEYRKQENEATRAMLLTYEPGLNLRYDKVSLEGSAVGLDRQLPMVLTDPKNGIWVVTADLKSGSIIFKTRYANYFNWGSDGEVGGGLRFWGEPIEVPEGSHRVEINLEEMAYKVVPQ